jgi:hypothetical protein
MRRNWRNEAQTAIEELKNSKYGDRESELRALARRFGNKSDDPSSLRRAIAAHEFLEKLRLTHPQEYHVLEAVPLSIAELIARWYAANQQQALAAARDWAQGRGTVQSIRKAMETNLPKGHGGKVGTARERAYRASALKQVASAVEDLTGSHIESLTERQRDGASGLKFDFLFEISSQDQRKKIAVLIVGPYTNKKMYRDRCDEWIARAFGLAWVVDRVMLVVPAAEYLEAYRGRARLVTQAAHRHIVGTASDQISGPRVDVAHIEVDPFDPPDSAALDRLET